MVRVCPACGDSDDCHCSREREERAERRAARRKPRAANPWEGALYPVVSQEDEQRWEREERQRRLERKRREEEEKRACRERSDRLETVLSQDFKVEMGRGDKWFEADLVNCSVTEKWRTLTGRRNRLVSRITILSGKGERGQYCDNYPPSVRLVGEDGTSAFITWEKFHELQAAARERARSQG